MPALALALPFITQRPLKSGGGVVYTDPINIVFEGDSITSGIGTVSGQSYANQIAGHANLAVSGSTITGAAPSLRNREATLDALIVPGANNVLIVMTGNDMIADTAALECSRLASYLDDRATAGWNTRIVISTLPRTTVGFNAKRNTANATKATWVGTHCEQFISLDSTSIGQDSDASDVAEYPDGIHPSAAAHAVIMAAVLPTINAFVPADLGPPETNLVEHWKLNTGLTQSGGFADSWTGRRRGFSLASTLTTRPAVQGDGSLLFDGINDYLQATFAYNTPAFTICLLMKQKTWTNTDCICDGKTDAYNALLQFSTANGIRSFNGSASSQNNDLALDTWATVMYGLSAAADFIQVDSNAPVTDTGLAPVPFGGFTLGALSSFGSNSHIQVKEVLIYRGVIDATARTAVKAYFDTVP